MASTSASALAQPVDAGMRARTSLTGPRGRVQQSTQSAVSQEARKQFAIPAGPLGDVLERFSGSPA